MDTRAERIEGIARWLTDHPGETLTGPEVEEMYAGLGVEVSGRQARRDVEDARRLAAEQLRSPALPHWSEDVTGVQIRVTIARVLQTDPEPTIPQLRRAVTAAHGRAIEDGELKQLARSVYHKLFILPAVAEARKVMKEQPGSSWTNHRARFKADPLAHWNPFGVDPEMLRIRAVRGCLEMFWAMEGLDRRMSRQDAAVLLRASRLMMELADGEGGGVTVSRLEQIRYDG